MMNEAQIYCSVKDVLESVNKHGEGRELMRYIRAASQWIQQNIGVFLPVTETRTFKPSCKNQILIGPALEIISVVENDVAVTDYEEDPYGGIWRKGPITALLRDNDLTWDQKLTITARWGLFSDLRSLGLTTSQTNSDTTLVVAKGGIISPGMVVDVDDEAELVTGGDGGPDSPAASAAVSLVNGAIDISDDTVTVDNGAEFFENEVIVIENEHILLKKRTGHVWSVERGWNGTTVATHANDSSISVFRTYQVERGVNGTTAAAHTTKAVSRYMVPDDVMYLCIEIAVLMAEKAGTMFGGRAGNANAGESFYVNEFPSQQIEKVKSNYWVPYL